MKIGDVEIKWLGHSGFLITPQAYPDKSSMKISTKGKNSKNIYIDPYKIKNDCEKADLILITHSHHDHCSIEDIEKIVKEGTKIILPADCQSKIAKLKIPVEMIVVGVGQEFVFDPVRITAFPAYNVDKDFHPKDEEGVGYLVKLNNVLIYHAGDTDVIPEMQRLTGSKQEGKKFVALLPVGGRFTMNAEEAAEAAELIKPDVAIPIHWGSIVGDDKDAEEFCELCREFKIDARVLEKS